MGAIQYQGEGPVNVRLGATCTLVHKADLLLPVLFFRLLLKHVMTFPQEKNVSLL